MNRIVESLRSLCRMACRAWRFMVQLSDLLILVRVPLLAVLAGVAAVVYVPQLHELFEISLSGDAGPGAAWFAFLFSAGLALVAWCSARALYLFKWPRRNLDRGMHRRLGVWLPRVLVMMAPLAMAGGYLGTQATLDDGSGIFWALGYLALAIGLGAFARSYRRAGRHLIRLLGKSPDRLDADPPVGRLLHWRELGRERYFHYAGMAALLLSWIVGAVRPGVLEWFGPLALIVGAAAFLVWASTFPVYLAARFRFPLITALIVLAFCLAAADLNDNHAVRLSAGHFSDQNPPRGLHYGAENRVSLDYFITQWREHARDAGCGDRIYLISSEGGGIRAAMWTVLVLDELDRRTGQRLWPCTLAVSGVSGGSLGLAAFALHWRDSGGRVDRDALVDFMQSDFLAPVLGSLFGVDLVQRVIPFRLFGDRGQALEQAWVREYAARVSGGAGSGFDIPLADTAFAPDGTPLPALFLNTTVVDSGMRLVQHPFAPLEAPELLPGNIDGAQWLPRELPLFSAVHNSARFTLVSPAGTVRRREGDRVVRLGQFVDGGYFENSAATVIEHLIRKLRAQPDGAGRLRVIHISNDPAIAGFEPEGGDVCPGGRDDSEAKIYGEMRAPLIAILATRMARGEYARRALAHLVRARPGDHIWHYRLCRRSRVIPLGWTIGSTTTNEMREQLGDAERISERIAADLPVKN